MDGSHDIGGDRIACGRLRDAKIRDLHLSVSGDDDILRFNIPVYDMISVRGFKSHGDLQRDGDRLLIAEAPSLGNVILESDSVHQFHYYVIDSLFFADVVHVDDIGVHQACCGLRFNAEFRDKICVLRKLLLENLDCYKAVQGVIF